MMRRLNIAGDTATTTPPSLQDRLQAAIESKKFNSLELRGFKINPNIALMAGAAIGYALASEDCIRKIKEST